MNGFPLSIDDFGTGYSSLEQLRRVPFSEMKIDRAFVHRANESPKARTILQSSANLGRNLGVSVVAEGAETQEDLEMLREIAVDFVQGYAIARPMAAEQVLQWCASWTTNYVAP
jgi:EAL domain-containing protein (putative c-di-GMP-specific phosphodiesterase class I)